MKDPHDLFLYVLIFVGSILAILGIGTIAVIVFADDKALALRLINVWGASFAATLTMLSGYLLGSNATRRAIEKDEDHP